jgi:hypothetical protein
MMSTVIREFIYVDIDRLYSMYSQLFEGVSEQVMRHGLDSVESGKSSNLKEPKKLKESSFENGNHESKTSSLMTIENKIRYDDIYNKFENKIKGAILEIGIKDSDSKYEDNIELIRDSFLVKVKGKSDIEDYDRITHFAANYDKYEKIFSMDMSTSVEGGLIRSLEEQRDKLVDRNQKSAMEARIKEAKKNFENKKSYTKTIMKNIEEFIRMTYSGGYEITMMPNHGDGSCVFRSILNKKWLRFQPEMLRALYGVSMQSELTVVGNVTYLPSVNHNEEAQESNDLDRNIKNSMRDPLRNMLKTMRFLDTVVMESNTRYEVLICPLAIYREITVKGLPETS